MYFNDDDDSDFNPCDTFQFVNNAYNIGNSNIQNDWNYIYKLIDLIWDIFNIEIKWNDDNNNYVYVQFRPKLNRSHILSKISEIAKCHFKLILIHGGITAYKNTNGFRRVSRIWMVQHFPYLPLSKIIFIYNIVICRYWSVWRLNAC